MSSAADAHPFVPGHSNGRTAWVRVVDSGASPLIVTLLLLAAACQPSPEGRQDRPAPVAEPGEASALSVAVEQRDDPAAGFIVVDSVQLAGEPRAGYRVELRVQAEQWPDGRILWEHAHRWVLLVRADDGVFVLMDEQVPNGHASFLLVETEQGPVVIVQTESGTSGVRVAAFTWEAPVDGYRQISEVRADGLLRHRTPSERFQP